jgi:hypothetical protein
MKALFMMSHSYCLAFLEMLSVIQCKMDELRGNWIKFRNEVVHNLYSSPRIIRVISWRRLRWTGHGARM